MNLRFITTALLFMNAQSTYAMMRQAYNSVKQSAATRLNAVKKHYQDTKPIDLSKQAALTSATLVAEGAISAVTAAGIGIVGGVTGGSAGVLLSLLPSAIDFHLITGKERIRQFAEAGLWSGAIVGGFTGYIVGACVVGPRGIILAPLTTAAIIYRSCQLHKQQNQPENS